METNSPWTVPSTAERKAHLPRRLVRRRITGSRHAAAVRCSVSFGVCQLDLAEPHPFPRATLKPITRRVINDEVAVLMAAKEHAGIPLLARICLILVKLTATWVF